MDVLMDMQQGLKAMREREHVIFEDGLEVLIKPIPETDEKGLIDPRFLKTLAPIIMGFTGLFLRPYVKSMMSRRNDMATAVKRYRGMNGKPVITPSPSLIVEDLTVANDGFDVPVRIYRHRDATETPVPVFYYIHGGGFIGGDMDGADDLCKKMALLSGWVVIQVEYRLAPEHAFPKGLDDCYRVLKWIHENIASYGGDCGRVYISGDSAGGNLASVCALRSKNEGLALVKAQGLLYPVSDVAHALEYCKASKKLYEMADRQKKTITRMADTFASLLEGYTMGEFLAVEDETIPELSPALADLSGMPPAIILVGEYDFFLVDNNRYAQALREAGVDTRLVRYRGVSHGFAGGFETSPQAVDALMEMKEFFDSIKEVTSG